MPCALTQGYNFDCRDSQGGVKAFYIMEHANLVSVATGGTTVTKAVGKRFWKYNPSKNTASFTETITGSRENGTVFYAQEAVLPLNKLQASVRNEILLLAQNKLVVVVEDMNGNGWLLGEVNGAFLNGGTISSGTAAADRNGYSLTFSGEEGAPAKLITAAALATLETPGV